MPHVVARGVEITVPRLRHPRVRGAVVHRVGPLVPDDLMQVQGIAVTCPARTLVDLAPRFSSQLAGRIIDDGLAAGLWTIHDLQRALGRAGSRAG